MRRFFVFLLLLPLPFLSKAQETITVMQYNLLQYGNYQSGYADCYETNNNTQHKDDCIRTVLDYVQPDILTVCEFGKTQQLQDDFLRHNLNVGGINYWKTDNIINYANSAIINHIFYDSRKMELKRHVALRTNPRDTDVYELYLKTTELLAGDTVKLVCIVTHPKAGQYYETDRLTTMRTVMNHVERNYANANVLIMGDFNMYKASESGYQLLTRTYSHSESLFVDPLSRVGGVGEWNNNQQFAAFHTQSTHGYSDECFSSGGLDDRFDFILMSDEIYMGFNKIKYVDNSYYAVGNDGKHFNQSIDQNGNTSVPAKVLDALFDISDHLPVTMKMNLYAQWGVEDQGVGSFRLYPNPVDDMITVETCRDASSQQQYDITNIMGQTLMSGWIEDGKQQIGLSGLPAGMYFLRVNGTTLKFIKR